MAQLSTWQQAQQAVLGSLFKDPDEYAGLIFQEAVPAMFGDPAMRHIFEAARDLWNDGRPIDVVTVGAKAGEEYAELIYNCCTLTPTAHNAPSWLGIMRDEAKISGLQSEAMAIVNAKTLEEAMACYERMGQLLSQTDTDDGMTLSEMISAYLDRMNDPKPVDYLRLGITQLDRALAISPGTFVIIAADSSAGKTALALQFSVHIATSGKRVGFFSLETPEEPLQNRLMAELQLAGIPMPSSQHKKLSDEDLHRAMEAGIRTAQTHMRFYRKIDTLEKIRAATIRHRFEVIFIDYVQLINLPGADRWQVVSQISMALHRMAQELGVTIIGLSQITTEKGRKTITVNDLRESRQLKQDAEVILLLNRSTDEEDDDSIRILDVGKNKDGWLPSIKLKFIAEHMTFTPLITMENIRSDGRVVRQQQEVDRKAKAKEKEPDPIPKDLAPGEFAEVQVSLDEIPF